MSKSSSYFLSLIIHFSPSSARKALDDGAVFESCTSTKIQIMTETSKSNSILPSNQPESNRLEENRESVMRQKQSDEELRPASDRESSGANSNGDQNQNTGNRSSNR